MKLLLCLQDAQKEEEREGEGEGEGEGGGVGASIDFPCRCTTSVSDFLYRLLNELLRVLSSVDCPLASQSVLRDNEKLSTNTTHKCKISNIKRYSIATSDIWDIDCLARLL